MRKGIKLFLMAAIALAVMCGAAFAAITAPDPTVVSVYSAAKEVESPGSFSGGTGALTATCPRASAPAAVWDGDAKKFKFQRGRGYNEGKYIYTVKDASGETCQYTVWVVDPANAASFKDMAVKTDASAPTFAVDFFNKSFSLSTDPEHPAAWESPRSGNGITTISWSTSDNKFTITKNGGSFTKDDDPVTITVNGVLKFLGQYIDGARDSGTLGSFFFTVNDFDVEPASIRWGSGGTRTDVAFTVKALTSAKIAKVELFELGKTTPSKTLKQGDDYKVADVDSGANVKITFEQAFLTSLKTGSHRVRITDNTSSPSAKTVEVIIRVTDGSTEDDVRMTIESPISIGDPIVAKVAKLTMHHVKGVGLKIGDKAEDDVTGRAHFEAADGGLLVILSSVLTEALHDGDKGRVAVTYDLGQGLGEKVVSDDFTIVQEPARGLKPTAISPDKAIADKSPEVAFGAPQTPATQFEVEYALSKAGVQGIKYDEYIDDDGRLTDVAAKALVGSGKILKTLPSAKMELPTPVTGTRKSIAPITFVVDGSDIVSNDAGQIRPSEARIHKIVVSGGKLESVQLPMAGDTIADGTYQIFEVLGGKLADTVTTQRPYLVVVYVEDNEGYDLDKDAGSVLDPVVIETSEGGTYHKSSGGSCDAGFGLAAFMALAALGAKTFRRRRK